MKKLASFILVLCLGIGSFAQNVNVSFKLKAINADNVPVDTTSGVYIVGTATNWLFRPMEDLGDHVYVFDTTYSKSDTISFYFILVNSWDSAGNQDWNYYKRFREYPDTADAICNPSWAQWKGDRWMIVPSKDTVVYVQWGLCGSLNSSNAVAAISTSGFDVYPNPSYGRFTVAMPAGSLSYIEIFDITGKKIKSLNSSEKYITVNIQGLPAGIYFLKASNGKQNFIRKISIK
jgi:hypothetical protein